MEQRALTNDLRRKRQTLICCRAFNAEQVSWKPNSGGHMATSKSRERPKKLRDGRSPTQQEYNLPAATNFKWVFRVSTGSVARGGWQLPSYGPFFFLLDEDTDEKCDKTKQVQRNPGDADEMRHDDGCNRRGRCETMAGLTVMG